MDSGVLPALKRKQLSKIKYGHAAIQKLLENLPDDTERDTVLRGGPDNAPVLLKRDNPWVIHFYRKKEDGGVLYYPWPQTPNAAMEEKLQKELFDIRTVPPLTALNHVRFFKERRILSVGPPGKAAKKWVENNVMPMQDGENAGKALIKGKWCVPGTSVSGHYGDYPEWILDEYQAKYPESRTKRRKKSQAAATLPPLPAALPAALPPLPLPLPAALPPLPARTESVPTALPTPALSPPRPRPAESVQVPSPAVSLPDSMFGSEMGVWNEDDEFDMEATLYDLDLTSERKEHVRRMINQMTKKQITAVLSRQCKLKWADDEKTISVDAMKDSLANVLFSPDTVYDMISAEYRLLAREGEFLYKVPVSVLKTEINKLLRKAGQDTI